MSQYQNGDIPPPLVAPMEEGAVWLLRQLVLLWGLKQQQAGVANPACLSSSWPCPAPPAEATPKTSSTDEKSPLRMLCMAPIALSAACSAAAWASTPAEALSVVTADSWRTALSRASVLPAASAVANESPMLLMSEAVTCCAAGSTTTEEVEHA